MQHANPCIRATYDAMWARATDAFAHQQLQLDPQLLDRAQDRRLGLGCIFRPDPHVQAAVQAVADDLLAYAPNQHRYQPEELHVSVITPIPSFVGFAPDAALLARYAATVAAVVAMHPSFTLTFHGVTASPSAVMIQGFFAPDTLDVLRTALLTALEAEGLADQLDQRYPLRGAHMTVLRFCRPIADPRGLYRRLAALRALPFGESRVAAIELVIADWYMSHSKVHVVASCQLERRTSLQDFR